MKRLPLCFNATRMSRRRLEDGGDAAMRPSLEVGIPEHQLMRL